MITRGYYIHFVEFRGAYSPNMCLEFNPSCATVPLAPTRCPAKNKGVRARHGLRAPCQRVRTELEVGLGTWELLPRAGMFAHTLVRPKKPGVYLLLTIFHNNI